MQCSTEKRDKIQKQTDKSVIWQEEHWYWLLPDPRGKRHSTVRHREKRPRRLTRRCHWPTTAQSAHLQTGLQRPADWLCGRMDPLYIPHKKLWPMIDGEKYMFPHLVSPLVFINMHASAGHRSVCVPICLHQNKHVEYVVHYECEEKYDVHVHSERPTYRPHAAHDASCSPLRSCSLTLRRKNEETHETNDGRVCVAAVR